VGDSKIIRILNLFTTTSVIIYIKILNSHILKGQFNMISPQLLEIEKSINNLSLVEKLWLLENIWVTTKYFCKKTRFLWLGA